MEHVKQVLLHHLCFLVHEIDHINGILFIDHLSKTKKDVILRKIKKQQKEKKQTA